MFACSTVLSALTSATAIASVAALALTAVAAGAAFAGTTSGGKAVSAPTSATDFSARRPLAPGAAAAAFAGIVGTGLAIAAAQNRRAYYDDYYGYGGGAVYVALAPGPYYYGAQPYGGYYDSGLPYVNGHPIASW